MNKVVRKDFTPRYDTARIRELEHENRILKLAKGKVNAGSAIVAFGGWLVSRGDFDHDTALKLVERFLLENKLPAPEADEIVSMVNPDIVD